MPLKDNILQQTMQQFLTACELQGWGVAPLLYLYNSEKSPEEQLCEKDFIEALAGGKISLSDFVYLMHAVAGNVSFMHN